VIFVVYALVAVLGTAFHLWRHPADRAADRGVEVALIWWIVVTIGVAGIVAASLHLFDGASHGKSGTRAVTAAFRPRSASAIWHSGSPPCSRSGSAIASCSLL